jgi:hypothetical protein
MLRREPKPSRPESTEAELMQWYATNLTAGDKYEAMINECRKAKGVTARDAKAAWKKFESPHKRKRGERDR